VTTLYGFLMKKGRIPDAWFGAQVDQADRVTGDIDTLSGRIAQIRTWTFVANRPDWLSDPDHWQGITREVENKLSDALHDRLTERFVDRRTSVLMRRLRENSVLNTEIGKTGEVTVEGHVIGRLDGFTFAPDAAEAGSDAKALQATAQKALAGEIDARAEKLSAAPDDQFVLTSDGTIRWTGDAVAKLVAADDALHPRLRIIADDRLNGAPREAVQTRLDLWLKTHIEKLLGPLFGLNKAEDITGIARGIAFQLIEALGVLERAKITAEMKDLDQPSRATLRKYGVRFGAYHLYLPNLLKPAVRALATQLWALKDATPDTKGLEEVPHLASSGRTSFPADKDVPKALYRVVGYRVCGERAVRVDILERLADLIRPALSWRPGSPAPKPPGAVEGGGFTVTVNMTSLTGSSGEDFASILKSLGYRMDKRVKPAESAPVSDAPAVATEAAPASTPVETADAPPAADVTAAEVAPEPVAAAEAAVPAAEPASEAPVEPVVAEVTAGDAASVEAAPAETKPAEPEMMEVWRPGRPPEERRPRPPRPQGERAERQGERRDRRPRPQTAAPQDGVQAAAPAGEAANAPATAEGGAARPERRDDRPRHGRGTRDERGGDKPEQREGRPQQRERRGGERPDRAGAGGQDRGPRREGRRDFKDRDRGGGEPREWRDPKERRGGQADPNSPFAKLAALKEQLEANKER
jgi:ATP-dependent RNA helicase SUPV3L1/SUV3